MEAEDKTLLEPIIDLLSWLKYKITSGDIDDEKKSGNGFVWLFIPLGTYLAWRVYHKQRVEQQKV